jgi:hypothetical protein
MMHPERLDALEDRQRELVVVEQDVFDRFQFEQVRAQSGLLQDRLHRLRQLVGRKLRRREIDADAEGVAGDSGASPLSRIANSSPPSRATMASSGPWLRR